jgi:hypothetical protein
VKALRAESGLRASGLGIKSKKKIRHREAEPVEGAAIYDFPLFLILKPKSWILNLK